MALSQNPGASSTAETLNTSPQRQRQDLAVDKDVTLDSSPPARTKRRRTPWQVDWKNPQWSTPSTDDDTNETTDDKDNDNDSINWNPLQCTSAMLDASEIPKDLDIHTAKTADTSTGPVSSYIMSVTLLAKVSSSSITGELQSKAESIQEDSSSIGAPPPKASHVRLEVTRLWQDLESPLEKGSPCTHETLVSKILTWPETIHNHDASSHHPDDTHTNAEESTLAEDPGSTATGSTAVSNQFADWALFPWLNHILAPPLERGPADTQQATADRGVVATALCRPPTSAMAQEQEALEVLNSMGLGLPGFDEPIHFNKIEPDEKNKSSAETADIDSPRHSEREEAPALRLACLSDQGLICVYDPWELLFPSRGTPSAQEQESRHMEEWLFGAALMQSLDSKWRPLSEPLTTISLSVLQSNWNFQHSAGKRKRKDTSVNRMVLWNPLIESSTLKDRTVWNQATSIQMVGPTASSSSSRAKDSHTKHSYLAILGQGIHYQDAIEQFVTSKKSMGKTTKVIDDVVTEEQDDHDQDAKSLSEGSNDEDVTTKTPDKEESADWWDEKPVDPDSVEPSDSKLDKSNISAAGFITLCSMAAWSEQKTIFLPFNPKSVHYIEEYRGMELLLCVGERSAAAVRLDVSSKPVLVGLDEFDIAATMSQRAAQRNAPKGTVRVPRYKVLPIEVESSPLSSENKLGQQLLCGSSTVPPTLLNLYTECNTTKEQQYSLLLRPTFAGITPEGVIVTTQRNSKVAKLPVQSLRMDLMKQTVTQPWGYSGQGYSIFGDTQANVYFICWEGSTGEPFSYLEELSPSFLGESWQHHRTDTLGCFSQILPLRVQRVSGMQKNGVQLPVLYTECKYRKSKSTLSMRNAFVQNGEASPFEEVLDWMSAREDFFTGASISLDLLKDPETLYHLWKHEDNIDQEDELQNLHGLLDGILPLDLEADDTKLEPESLNERVETRAKLADTTISCLVRGGFPMSSTLERFLELNQDYESEQAAQLLIAAVENEVSNGIISGSGPKARDLDEMSLDSRLWSLSCLLDVGLRRDCLQRMIALLNHKIPNEMRNVNLSSLSLTKAIIGKIVSTDKSAIDILLSLKDSENRDFWESLDLETKRSLILIEVGKTYPLLAHSIVREWVRQHLHACVTGNAVSPSDWLRSLVSACLVNAGCEIQDLIVDPTNESQQSLYINAEMEKGLGLFKLEVAETRNALRPSEESDWLDFDLLIPPLLLLCSHQVHWRSDPETNYVATQVLLDGVCYWTGREKPASLPMFPVDSPRLMQQCALSGNVRAGACLISGKNGFVLSCCDILMFEVQVPIARCEEYILAEELELATMLGDQAFKSLQPEHFEVTESHRRLLWLLDEHVLNIHTYGAFGTTETKPRGFIDPVFAATSVLRVWICLTHPCRQEGSSWLEKWLTERLGFSSSQKATSTHRLACAALSRAFLWSFAKEHDVAETGSAQAIPLGEAMKMDRTFLILVAQSACGVAESVPDTETGTLINMAGPKSSAWLNSEQSMKLF